MSQSYNGISYNSPSSQRTSMSPFVQSYVNSLSPESIKDYATRLNSTQSLSSPYRYVSGYGAQGRGLIFGKNDQLKSSPTTDEEEEEDEEEDEEEREEEREEEQQEEEREQERDLRGRRGLSMNSVGFLSPPTMRSRSRSVDRSAAPSPMRSLYYPSSLSTSQPRVSSTYADFSSLPPLPPYIPKADYEGMSL